MLRNSIRFRTQKIRLKQCSLPGLYNAQSYIPTKMCLRCIVCNTSQMYTRVRSAPQTRRTKQNVKTIKIFHIILFIGVMSWQSLSPQLAPWNILRDCIGGKSMATCVALTKLKIKPNLCVHAKIKINSILDFFFQLFNYIIKFFFNYSKFSIHFSNFSI